MDDRTTEERNTAPLFLTDSNRKRVINQQMLAKEEYEAVMAKHIAAQAAGCFVIKLPNSQALHCQGPSWSPTVVWEQMSAAHEEHRRVRLSAEEYTAELSENPDNQLHRLCGLPPSGCWLVLPLHPQTTPWPPRFMPLLQALVNEGRRYGARLLVMLQAAQPPSEGR